ncbi:sensor domain-containing diguanylate cyclase [Alkalibacter rhizosphaerae]|uniref:Sensor domain-containing diguanylate cyclase n=1 Tax=Alkalibacter rhizosphaerae TaxID=2815577 RepID=A0A975AI84_9FIRM|nr:sensor domain-containing diguanylate cyclase [Alkalibacter rhizosphaerae]QSX09202.1 sensor domain-containing diguanylate cyclase [Alkalibacter rhizosphaerae]
MDYSNYTKEELIQWIEELQMLNRELLTQKEQEDKLDFAWTGNLGHWYLNFKTGNIVFNPLKASALGYSMDELPERIGYDFFTDKLYPDDYLPTMKAMKDHMDGKIPVYECEYRIYTKDGSVKWFFDRGKVTQRDEDGKALFAAGIVFDITDQKNKEEKLRVENELLEVESNTDPLTEIRNRGAIMEELDNQMKTSLFSKEKLHIAIFDIDHFKEINDTKGHVFGDTVLKEVAKILSGSIRGLDSVGRYGGEEFLVILPNTSKEGAEHAGERIRSRIEEHVFGEGVKVTISGGIAQYQMDSAESFINRADKKLYEAKKSGRNQVMG